MELIQQRLRAFVTENFLFGQDEDLLAEDSLIDKGVIDSTGVLQLIAYLEREFGIDVEDREVIPQNLDSLERLAAFVQRKQDAVREEGSSYVADVPGCVTVACTVKEQ